MIIKDFKTPDDQILKGLINHWMPVSGISILISLLIFPTVSLLQSVTVGLLGISFGLFMITHDFKKYKRLKKLHEQRQQKLKAWKRSDEDSK